MSKIIRVVKVIDFADMNEKFSIIQNNKKQLMSESGKLLLFDNFDDAKKRAADLENMCYKKREPCECKGLCRDA